MKDYFRALAVRLILVFLLINGACDGVGPDRSRERPSPTLELGQTSARPFEVVSLLNLPDTLDARILVDDAEVPLIYNPLEDVHLFVVPPALQGDVTVTIPGPVTGAEEVRLDLSVVPQEYVGGSPEAASAALTDQLDGLQVYAGLAVEELDTIDDSSLVAVLDGLSRGIEAFQQEFASLSETDRELVLAAFSANAEDLDAIRGTFSERVENLQDLPPLSPEVPSTSAGVTVPPAASVLSARSVQAGQAVRTAEEIARNCIQANLRLERYQDWASINWRLTAIAGLTSLLGNVPAGHAALYLTLVDTALQAAIILESRLPNFVAADGLKLRVSPSRVPDDGSSGTMTAYVKTVNARGLLASEASLSTSLVSFGLAYASLPGRALSGKSELLLLLANVGLGKLADEMSTIFDHLSELYSVDLTSIRGGEQQIAFDGLTIDGTDPDFWQFTSPMAGAKRTFETTQTLPEARRPDVYIGLFGRAGRGQNCTAEAAPPMHAQGLNGFIITAEGSSLRFSQYQDQIELRAGEAETVTFTLENAGYEPTGQLTYAFDAPFDGTYAGVTVTRPDGPSSLEAGQLGFVEFQIRTRPDAPSRLHLPRLIVYEDGVEATSQHLGVYILPQLTDIVVNQASSSINLVDSGRQDGDLITIRLNGATVISGHSLLNSGTEFPVAYRNGRNVLTIEALNEGSLVPNTAQVEFRNVTSGQAVQQYGLNTGQVVTVNILLDPDSGPVASSSRTAVGFMSCPSGAGDYDCYPGR